MKNLVFFAAEKPCGKSESKPHPNSFKPDPNEEAVKLVSSVTGLESPRGVYTELMKTHRPKTKERLSMTKEQRADFLRVRMRVLRPRGKQEEFATAPLTVAKIKWRLRAQL